MFHLTLAAVATLMHLYLFLRITSVARLRAWLPIWVWWGLGGLIWGLYLAGGLLGHPRDDAGIWGGLDRLAMIWLGVLFLSFAMLLLVDLLTGFGLWFRGALDRLRMGGLGVALLLVGVALVQGGRTPVVVEYEVRMHGLPDELDGTTLVAMSDLHLGSQNGVEWLRARVAQVEALEPDLVVLVGDLVEGHGRTNTALGTVLAGLRAPFGVYAVTGNHESFGGAQAGMELLADAGVKWLQDRCVSVMPGLALAGVDDLTSRRHRGDMGEVVGKALDDCPPGERILLSHTPWEAETAAAHGARLMLSGHTHGGQLWPFGYLVQLYYPMLAGRYEVEGLSVIVGRGTGLWGPPMRLWHPAEILRVTLRAGPP